MLWRVLVVRCWVATALLVVGCGRGPARVDAPDVDAESAADMALELYDANGDGALDGDELRRCPGIRSMLSVYDQDSNGRVDRAEVAQRLGQLFKNRVGATQLRTRVTYHGRPLKDAAVLFEPEPYLGDEVQTARGKTNAHGSAQMGIGQEKLPKNLRHMMLVHYGTYKVRITHPTIKLPAKYNSDTTLGYETKMGDPFVTFTLVDR